jgi:hypothetical protein
MRQTDGMEKYNPRTSAFSEAKAERKERANKRRELTPPTARWSLFRAVYVQF